MVSTNFSKVSQVSTNFLMSIHGTDVLLLEDEYELLLETGDSLLLEETDILSTNYTKETLNSTNYT